MFGQIKSSSLDAEIEYKLKTLEELYLLDYCTPDEIAKLKHAESIPHADRIMRDLIDRHYDEMLESIEHNILDDIENERIEFRIEDCAELKKITKTFLLRAGFETFEDVVDFISEYGWKNIHRLGISGMKNIIDFLLPGLSDEKALEIIKKYELEGFDDEAYHLG